MLLAYDLLNFKRLTIVHQSSIDKMQDFRDRYLSGKEKQQLKILDIGSMSVNGSYKPIFADTSWHYQGLDMAAGPNVDICLDNPYDWHSLASDSQDVIISGQALEHVEFFWVTMLEIERVMKPGGLCCIIVPSSGPQHRYPVDCWRFYPDGVRALGRYVGLEVLEAETQWKPQGYTQDASDLWKDTVLIAKKPVLTGLIRYKSMIKKRLLRRLAEPRF